MFSALLQFATALFRTPPPRLRRQILLFLSDLLLLLLLVQQCYGFFCSCHNYQSVQLQMVAINSGKQFPTYRAKYYFLLLLLE